jgi:hypothetical protein
MPTLFQPFTQAQRLTGGTGLGLFSLAQRMKALGGHCGVQRREDGLEGSLFWFAMPYRIDDSLGDINYSSQLESRSLAPVSNATPSTMLVSSEDCSVPP